MKKLKLTIHDYINFQIEGLSEKELTKLQQKTSLPVKGAYTTAAYKAGIWNGRESLIDDDGYGCMYEINKVIDIIEEMGYDPDRDIVLIEKVPQFIPYDIEINDDWVEEESGYKYRDYQLAAVRAAIDPGNGVFDIGTNGGKTWICVGISKAYDPYMKTLVIVPSEKLVKQTAADYAKTKLKFAAITKSIKTRDKSVSEARHVIITTKLFLNIYHMFTDEPWAIMYDECFHPSHELLTRDGWKPISSICIGDEVMAYNHTTHTSAFERVTRTIKKPFSGSLKHLKNKNVVDVLVTPNHEQPVIMKSGVRKKVMMRDFKKGMSIPVSAPFCGEGQLSPMDRLRIAFEADGHLLMTGVDGIHRYRFAFRRDRKIERLEWILNECGIAYRKARNKRNDTNITFMLTEEMEKSLTWFNPYVSAEKNSEFVQEVGLWDGHIKSSGVVEWNNANEKEIEFLAIVASLGGYHTSIATLKQQNSRGENVIRINCKKKTMTKMTETSPIDVPYEGDVFCVSVPSGNLLTRRGGVTSISGNCHVFGDQFSEVIRFGFGHCPVRLGMSATLPPAKKDPYKRNKIFSILGGGIVANVEQKELIRRGISSQISIEMILTNDAEFEALCSLDEYDWSMEDAYNESNIHRLTSIADFIRDMHEKDPTNTLILCKKGAAIKLAELLGTDFIVDGTTEKERDLHFTNFGQSDDYILTATFGTTGTGISENRIFRMFFIDVGKNDTYIIQGLGRGLRLDGEKNKVDVFDISSNNKYAKKHRNDRKKIYERDGYPHHISPININVRG